MTSYVFAYDLESDICVRAAAKIAEIHRAHGVPATFFVLGKMLETHGDDLRRTLGDDPLFDIQSHTYSHKLLKNSLMHGPGIGPKEVAKEIELGKSLVEDTFGIDCLGVRSGCGFYRGLQGERETLEVIWDSGIKYISTDLRGPADSIPSGIQQAYSYDEEGFPDLLELPGHGWHDNVLKSSKPMLCLSWPPFLSWGIPKRPPGTPREEVDVQRVWLDRAISLGLDYISLVYHPHSIYRINPECSTVELLIEEVEGLGLQTKTYTQLYSDYSSHPERIPGREAWKWRLE